jgi:hypothetical protein
MERTVEEKDFFWCTKKTWKEKMQFVDIISTIYKMPTCQNQSTSLLLHLTDGTWLDRHLAKISCPLRRSQPQEHGGKNSTKSTHICR